LDFIALKKNTRKVEGNSEGSRVAKAEEEKHISTNEGIRT